MARYRLEVFFPVTCSPMPHQVPSEDLTAWRARLQRTDVATVVHVLALEVAQGLDWVKRNADRIAGEAFPFAHYTALMVSEA